MHCAHSSSKFVMDCGRRAEQMWSPSGEATRMDDFRARVNVELQLTLSEWCFFEKSGDLWSSKIPAQPHPLPAVTVI